MLSRPAVLYCCIHDSMSTSAQRSRSMSTHSRSGAVLTIADVIARVTANPDLSPARRADLTSALRTACRVLNAEPDALVANMQHLRKALSNVSLAAADVSARRWSNVRSLTLAALVHAGV